MKWLGNYRELYMRLNKALNHKAYELEENDDTSWNRK